MTMTVNGVCDPAFQTVQEVFAELMQGPQEQGASVAVYHQGELKVNLWAGTRDKARSLPWQQDTLVNVFSTTKGVAALAVQRALDQGLLDPGRRVSYYWPEYGTNGKKDTLVGWILNHRAGQPALKTPLPDEALFDWEWMTATLAREEPWWEPGRRHGYHMITYGWLLGEVFRRAVGVTLGQYLREEIALPFGLDLHLGLDAGDLTRVADLSGASWQPEPGRVYLLESVAREPDSVTAKALCNPMSLMTSANKRPWRVMELPSANLHATAAALASLYGKAVCDEGLLSAQALQRCLQEESAGDDPVLQTRTRFGPGFMLQQQGDVEAGFGPAQTVFGHPGSGGSLALGDPQRQLGFAFVMNQMGPYVLVDPRPRALLEAVYASLSA